MERTGVTHTLLTYLTFTYTPTYILQEPLTSIFDNTVLQNLEFYHLQKWQKVNLIGFLKPKTNLNAKFRVIWG